MIFVIPGADTARNGSARDLPGYTVLVVRPKAHQPAIFERGASRS